jgi:putative tryptophan/tyrosine transport system substrate-binding protein
VIQRRTFVAGIAAVMAAPLSASAQQAAKVYRVGILGNSPPTTPGSHLWEALFEALRERGYKEGENLVLYGRFAEGREERLLALAADLVRLKVDVIVAGATQPAEAARHATKAIPIVMANHSDPVATGMVASLARPGGNVTGLSIENPDLMGKRLETFRQAIPSLARAGVLTNPTHQAHPKMLDEAENAARALRIDLHPIRARGQADYDSAFFEMAKARVDGALILGDVIFWRDRSTIAAVAMKHRLPTMFAQREHVEAGGLMHYGPDLRECYRRAADFVDKILSGRKPGDLPIELPTRYQLTVNVRTANALGLTIPRSLLLRADEVIQ